MAMALVGGAFLSSFLNVLFDRMATREILKFFRSKNINMGLLEKLKTLLNTADGVLHDAEHKQITRPAVKTWLDDLRDAAYEADDLLDLIAYEATAAKLKAKKQSATGNQATDLLSFRNPFKKASENDHSDAVVFSKDVPERMEEIVLRLDDLVKQIGLLGLRDGGRKDASPGREPTTSVVKESGIFGRDDDKEAIFNLLQATDANENSIGVIPIVGMGGIGKTTLAQLVYNDRKVHDLFEFKAWVCVSENYDGFRIKREFLKQVKNSEEFDGFTPQQVDVELGKSLEGKKYLLVLDDIWNESNDDWESLQAPLQSGAYGSKIIVTTRNQNVASIMSTAASSYQLSELNNDSCWLLFEKYAFKCGNEDQRLQSIGKKIVMKCKGLPLAVKMLGSLLQRKRDVEKWNEILKSNIWDLSNNNVLPALRLSYWHLPSYLQQCFAYCAIFPKDYEIQREEIIQVWMGEGFLEQIGGKRIEELAEECLDELVSRSFLQESKHSWGGPPFFCMHDLINDLAQHISGEFLVRKDENNPCKIGKRCRHFSCSVSEVNSPMALEDILEAQALRTFWLCSSVDFGYRDFKWSKEITDKLLHNQVPLLKCLRTLSLRGLNNFMELPDSIGNLKHLRHLNLTRTNVVRLPDTVCCLYKLQTIILFQCYCLVELPKDIGSLINLHCLDIRNTPILQEMPPKMGNLKDLRTLGKFIVGKQNGSDVNELGKLQHLRGELSILDLQNVVDAPKGILKKNNFKYLELQWSGETDNSEHERSVLEGLQPHTSIKKLLISGYGGTKLADWIGEPSYINIISLELKGCKHCTFLPPLGQLPFLENLTVSNFDAVVEVGDEFFWSSGNKCKKTSFKSLKTLSIKGMSQWQNGIVSQEEDSVKCELFPKLEKLDIEGCPKLKAIATCEQTRKIFKSLNELYVESCPNLKTSNLLAVSNFKQLKIESNANEMFLKRLPSDMYSFDFDPIDYGEFFPYGIGEECNPTIEGDEEMQFLFDALDFENIDIFGNDLLESIPLEVLPNLKDLRISDCCNLKSISLFDEPIQQPLELTSLEIRNCPSLIYFPQGGIPAPNLTRLKLFKCSCLKSLPQCMHTIFPSRLHLEIHDCKELESFPGGLPANLQSLEIFGCDKLIRGRLQWGLEKLGALSHLLLFGYDGDDLDSFPEETLLPSTLGSLSIGSFRRLKCINHKGIQHLSCLAELRICACANLQWLPKGGLPSCLSILMVQTCPQLKSFTEGGLPTNLQSLDVKFCHKFIEGRAQWGLQRLDALSCLRLSLYGGDDLESFPEHTLLPSTLRSLHIDAFENLEVINYKGLQHLTLLTQLEITRCDNLRCLPKEGLPSSLSVLKIEMCPELEQRCEREKGEDWPKISRIST